MDHILKPLRLEKGWSQDQLAEISGLSIRTIQRVENGAHCSLETAKALAAVFDTSPDSFIKTSAPLAPEQSEQLQTIKHNQILRRRIKFVRHLLIYCAVNAGLMFLNLSSADDKIWFHYMLLGWGVGLAFHALKVFFVDWEDALARHLMKKE